MTFEQAATVRGRDAARSARWNHAVPPPRRVPLGQAAVSLIPLKTLDFCDELLVGSSFRSPVAISGANFCINNRY